MSEKTEHPAIQPTEHEPTHEHEHSPVVYSSYLEEGHGPMERMRQAKGERKVEELKINSTRQDNLPFHILGAGGFEYSLEKANDEIREEFHRQDVKKHLEAVAATGPVPAGKTKKKGIF